MLNPVKGGRVGILAVLLMGAGGWAGCSSTAPAPLDTQFTSPIWPLAGPGAGKASFLGQAGRGSTLPSASNAGVPAWALALGGAVGQATEPGGDCTLGATAGMAGAAGAGGAGPTGPLTVLVVFDKSGSMATPWDGRTRFDVANEALLSAIVGIEDTLTIGAIRFPLGNYCGVLPLEDPAQINFMSGREFTERWKATTPANTPDGNTPLALALAVADTTIRAAQAKARPGDRFRVAVVTDGEPNCSGSNQDLVGFPAYWRKLGIETVILGIPGSEAAQQVLSSMQTGRGCFVQTSTSTALNRAVYAILR